MEAVIALILGFGLVARLFTRKKKSLLTSEPDSYPLVNGFSQDLSISQAPTQVDFPDWLHGYGNFDLEVVGGLHSQYALEQICEPRMEAIENGALDAALVLEEASLYDRNAVRVQIHGRIVGYLTRCDAKALRNRLSEEHINGIYFPCKAKIRRGGERSDGTRGSYDVWLDVALHE